MRRAVQGSSQERGRTRLFCSVGWDHMFLLLFGLHSPKGLSMGETGSHEALADPLAAGVQQGTQAFFFSSLSSCQANISPHMVTPSLFSMCLSVGLEGYG